MANTTEKCRLVRMEIENFMRCRLVRLTFGDEPIIPIEGWNGEGKSSVLRAFWALVGGKDACPEDPIRHGADSAQILGELDNGLVIRRRFTASGKSYLEVQTKDGASYKSPQTILDELVGRISFDPLAFLSYDAKKQRDTLQKIAGVDVTPIREKRQSAYDERTLANRRVTGLKARLDAMPDVEAPDEEVTAADLLAEQRRLQAVKAANDAKRAELRRFHDADFKRAAAAVETCEKRVADLERQLAAARAELEQAQAAKVAAAEKGKALQAEVQALVDPDMDAVQRRIAEVDQTNRAVRAKKEKAALAGEHVVALEEWQRLDAAVKAAEAEEAKALAEAAFPIDGLGFGAVGITYQGIPFEQASQAQQIRVSMAMGLALNPKLPVVCIRDGSLLDPKSYELVREMAAEAGAQVLLEIVGKGRGGIVIEDGVVEGAPASGEAA